MASSLFSPMAMGTMGVFQKNKAVRIDKTYVLSEMGRLEDEGERQ